MSHVATIKIKIRDLEALKVAAQECGLEFREGQKTYRWYGRWVKDYHAADAAYKNGIKPEDYGKCEHALSNPSNPQGYEVGVVKSPDNDGYTLIWDFYGQNNSAGLLPKIGRDGEKLQQAYAVNVAKSQLRKRGFNFREEKQKDGSIKLIAQQR